MIEVEEELFPNETDSVQKIEISSKEAFDLFSKKELDGSFVDFSDSISKRLSSGYLVDDLKRIETPLQKYNRLFREINSLKNDLQNVSNEEKESEAQDVDSLLKEVEKLQKHASTLQLGTVINKQYIDRQTKKNLLMEQLSEFKQMPHIKQEPQSQVTDHNNSIVFKIFNDLDRINLKDSSKVMDLNQRLSRLESILDSKTNKDLLANLTVNSDNKTILGLVEHLNMKMKLIDTQSIEIIESKLQWMIQKVNQLNEKKAVLDDNEKYNKINELYNKLVKWQDMFAMFPKLIERLASLNELHQQASHFATTLSRLDTENLDMKQKLDANVEFISQVCDFVWINFVFIYNFV